MQYTRVPKNRFIFARLFPTSEISHVDINSMLHYSVVRK